MATETTVTSARAFRVAWSVCLMVGLTSSIALARPVTAQDVPASSQPLTLPVTTSSAAAAAYFEKGMREYEMHRWNLALNDWNEAVKLDPHFALAHAWICMTTVDPAEEAAHRDAAETNVMQVTLGEQLVIEWMAGMHENHYLHGITAMNDVLAMYPHDKRLNFLFGYWLYRQDQYDVAERLTQKALAEDPKYATAWNQLAYIYSRRGDYPQALMAARRYVDLLPDQPNPHDSYGEMLRLSGRFEEALDQYRMALKIDPTFYISQKELGETYAIMGQGEKARQEYAKAVHEAPSDGLKAEYLQKAAMTFVRAGQFDEADKAYLSAAEKAHAMQQWVWEARAYRIMAMYASDAKAAMKDLDKAEALLAARQGSVAQADLDEEHARIWRVRAERAATNRDFLTADKAIAALQQMADSAGSTSIERIYEGAVGTVLATEGKFADAIPHLEEDFANPLSMKVLVDAYEKTKAKAQASSLRQKLQAWRIPSVEEALVVPAIMPQRAGLSKR